MAQFTAQGRLKLLLNGNGLPTGSSESKSKNPYHNNKLSGGGGGGGNPNPISRPAHKRKLISSALNNKNTRGRSFSSSPPSQPSSSKRKTDDRLSEATFYGENFSGDDDISEFDSDDELSSFRGLVLDVSYRPVNVVCWKRAICLEFLEKADVLEYYDQTVSSPSGSFYIPAVLRVPHLLQVVKIKRVRNTLSRKNILFRDSFTCQYCSSRENLTIDHVKPMARGGEWEWENLVTACFGCNSKKGQKTLEEANMKLLKVPKAPKEYDILAIPLTNFTMKMLKTRKGTPEEWRQYLS
ncbi:uncharacterized protein LOC124910689 [Impatiens glandulifera]|uniref:uncharacterized protein LOC124910689 n=1 Tax=Impatiens glandulifera TaxID=253017 RepID=UPI001FB10427|nr:uncharacterized protein LOC124910689 [Impatiens glandulifera]